MNNDFRFDRLTDRVSGYRKLKSFEYTFGLKPEESAGIVPPADHVLRILGQLEFALKLDKYDENSGIYSKLISNALDILERGLDAYGTLTRNVCAMAEEALLPMSTDAKEYEVILCGHAHIDMNWMWSYNETVASALATFTTMLDLMDEYPEFTFSQSQASVYKIVEEHDADLMERIKEKIREGRWEVTAGAWVETDKNMPSGESLLKTIEYTKKYMEEVWDVPAESLEIDFSPDTFGHSLRVPEIDRVGGLKYYYHCRGLDEDYILYRYRALSGAEVLCYREPYWYNSGITPHVGVGLPGLSARMGGLKTGLIVYGVGDHGGGVTRRDIEKALEMRTWPVFPRIRFGTFGEFFKLADTPEIRGKLPAVEHDINFLFDGCYTTQSRIKKANRYSEAKLIAAEKFGAIASAIGADYRYNRDGFGKAWQNVLFTHFHDIITGSCVQDSREYAMALHQRAQATAETEENKALRAISRLIDTTVFSEDRPIEGASGKTADYPYGSMSEGAGAGFSSGSVFGIPNPERGRGITRVFNIFNTADVVSDGPAELTVWDWPGNPQRVMFVDTEGRRIEFAPVDGGPQRYWDHSYMRYLLNVRIPANGYVSVAMTEAAVDEYPFRNYCGDWGRLPYENRAVLENGNIRAEFDPATMALTSLRNKETGEELLDEKEFSGLAVINTQDNPMTAWMIGRHLGTVPVTNIKSCGRYAHGRLRQGYSYRASVLGSSVTVNVSLDAGSKMLNYDCTVDWNERSGETLPLLAFVMSLKNSTGKMLRMIPMGAAVTDSANHDIPSLAFVSDGNAALGSDCKYGFRSFNGKLILSLINTAHNPDPLPERFIHNFVIRAGFTDGGVGSLLEAEKKLMYRPVAIPVNPHCGVLPPDGELLSVDAGTASVSSVRLDNGGRLTVRLFEYAGNVVDARAGCGSAEGCAEIKPYSIAEIELKEL